jgi:hypothetical protein
MTQTPNQQELEAFLQGKPVSTAFHTELSTRVEALLKGLEASTKDLTRPGAGSLQRPTEPIVKD